MHTFDRKESDHRTNSLRHMMQNQQNLARNKAISAIPDLLHMIVKEHEGVGNMRVSGLHL